MKKFLVILLAIFPLSCAQRERGFYFSENALRRARNLDAYNSTREDVISNFGQPSLELEDGTWLYYSYTYNNPPFKKNRIGEDRVLLIYFDGDDKISKYSFRERKINGNIMDVEQKNREIKGNIFREFFRGLIFTPIGKGGVG
jgi:hypothetical protein